MTALEYVGAEYDTEFLNLMKGDQQKPEYHAVNPQGKVPALLVDGELLTENAAIITWSHAEYPQANLFPAVNSNLEKAKQLSDLFWISAGWHPYVRANRMPIRWTVGDPEPVREKGRELLQPLVAQLESRLEEQEWYYGNEWSIVDVYLYWCYTTAEEGGFSLEGCSNIARHRAAVEAMPAFQAAKAKEKAVSGLG